MDIHELYKTAGELHGHLCPGLAIGVRASVEAQSHGSKISACILGHRACWVDGIISVLGIKPEIDEQDKAFFDFVGEKGSFRLMLGALPKEMEKPALIEYILTAPMDKIFELC